MGKEKKNIYLVRLNKLYHYLKEHNATVTIDSTVDKEKIRVSYKPNRKEFNLKDLFSYGCDINSTRALKEITGSRSFIESKEIGKYSIVLDRDKDIILSIQYGFKNDREDTSSFGQFCESRKGLFLKKSYLRPSFINIRKTYKTAANDIRDEVLYLVENGFINAKAGDIRSLDTESWTDEIWEESGIDKEDIEWLDGHDIEGLFEAKWKFGPLSDFYQFEWFNTVPQSVRDELYEIVGVWQQHFPPSKYENNNLIFPGVSALNIPYKNNTDINNTYKNLSLSEIEELLKDKNTWVSVSRYHIAYRLLEILKENEMDEPPKYAHALILLMGAEFTSLMHWLKSTAEEEVKTNVEFVVRFTSEVGKAEKVTTHKLTYDELTSLLEDYNFDNNPREAFRVNNNNVLKTPIYRFASHIDTDFLYTNFDFEFALRANLYKYFYSELKKHTGLSDVEMP